MKKTGLFFGAATGLLMMTGVAAAECPRSIERPDRSWPFSWQHDGQIANVTRDACWAFGQRRSTEVQNKVRVVYDCGSRGRRSATFQGGQQIGGNLRPVPGGC
jgi:hypothetical protein